MMAVRKELMLLLNSIVNTNISIFSWGPLLMIGLGRLAFID